MVVVLGAGINGAAVARELVLSGVSVAVVDAHDIACGATAWSTRLIHGGLRYLEYGEIDLVRESLVERDRLARLAPHLVASLPFYVPVRGRLGGVWAAAARLAGCEALAKRLRGSRGRGAWTLGIGLTLYDLLSVGSRWPRHRIVRAGRPGLPRIDPVAYPLGGTYADGQSLYPERLAVEMLVDAQRVATTRDCGFSVHARCRARLDVDGGVVVTSDKGVANRLAPVAIVNATGAWVDFTLHELFPQQDAPLIGGTKGSHLVIRAAALRDALGDYGVYAEADDGRPVFVLPFGPTLVLVGTTDLPYAGDPAAARADEAEIDYLLAAVGRLFPAVAPGRSAVQQHYSGVRPLPFVAPARGGAPGAITRRHMFIEHPDAAVPLWSVVGGKLTTCRSLAESLAAKVLPAIGMSVQATSRARPFPGAWENPEGAASPPSDLVAATVAAALAVGVATEEVAHVAARLIAVFGVRAVDACREPPPPGWAGSATIADVGLPTTAIWFVVRHEWAVGIDDIVERRLMLVFDSRLSRRSLDDIAAALVACGTLTAAQREAAVERYAARLGHHLGKSLAPAPETMP